MASSEAMKPQEIATCTNNNLPLQELTSFSFNMQRKSYQQCKYLSTEQHL